MSIKLTLIISKSKELSEILPDIQIFEIFDKLREMIKYYLLQKHGKNFDIKKTYNILWLHLYHAFATEWFIYFSCHGNVRYYAENLYDII